MNKQPQMLTVQEILDELEMLSYEMSRIYESSDEDPGRHNLCTLESIRLARLHAKAACAAIVNA